MVLIKTTKDNSNTLFSEHFNEHYHSTNGAINESIHVFINAGLRYFDQISISILEVGYGTGLNSLLTFIESESSEIQIQYTSLEKFPVDLSTTKKLNFHNELKYDKSIFEKMHSSEWNSVIQISKKFKLKKLKIDLLDFIPLENQYDLIYFDAFSPDTQPELWSQDVFKKLYSSLKVNGILTTYSSKGLVKNNLREAGFIVKRLPGPTGKRHMLRAIKE